MPTGYEVQMYNDIARIRKALDSIAKSLEVLAKATTDETAFERMRARSGHPEADPTATDD